MEEDVLSTLYMPIVSPPTPAPSPRPAFASLSLGPSLSDPVYPCRREFASLTPSLRRQYLSAILTECSPSELLFVSTTIAPLLKRDFLHDLPPEIALHVLSFVDDPKTLARASQVSKYWNYLLDDSWLWRRMCVTHGFETDNESQSPGRMLRGASEALASSSKRAVYYPTNTVLPFALRSHSFDSAFSYRQHFKYAYVTNTNWLHGGRLLRSHRVPLLSPTQQPTAQPAPNVPGVPALSSAIPTSVAVDANWVVVGLANSRIHVFSAKTGVLSRTLVGHESGVWAVALIKGGGAHGGAGGDGADVEEAVSSGEEDLHDAPPGPDQYVPHTLRFALGLDQVHPRRRSSSQAIHGRPSMWQPWQDKPSDPSGASDGWGQPNALVVSGGCDKELRVWDVKSGYCIYVLRGHTSTIRCLKMLHGRPLAVSGSRDRTVRVWDVQRGTQVRVFSGHEQSVRCLDVCGSRVVSGSYDCTCRLWDVDTGECLHVLRGHFHQIYSVAFDGVRIASGGLDTTVRVWDAKTGTCLALLQGHTALVCQLQLSPTMLATGGSDGRVITFSLESSFSVVQRLAAHDSSVTGLQLDERFLVTSGNDGRVRLFQFGAGGRCEYVRELSEPSESVWKVAYTRETCAIMCKRAGKTVMEIWSFKPKADL
ncbi:WD40-repeat-containing domain protein [Sparassis latifolia]